MAKYLDLEVNYANNIDYYPSDDELVPQNASWGDIAVFALFVLAIWAVIGCICLFGGMLTAYRRLTGRS